MNAKILATSGTLLVLLLNLGFRTLRVEIDNHPRVETQRQAKWRGST
jgi:hypothetical protein